MIPSEFKKDISRITFQKRPHIVILGAGASVAVSQYSDFKGTKLPVMRELPDVLELHKILDKSQLKQAKDDYESFYDSLVQSNNIHLQLELEKRTENYFNTIKVQDTVTLYDKLVLGLRPKDTIFSFNWDPLLPYAYRRNASTKKTLPALWFLHGNVLLGVCNKCKSIGWMDCNCLRCGVAFTQSLLLFPIRNKDYNSDPVIAEAWMHLDREIMNAYFVSFFGYSAPSSDTIARNRIIANLSKNDRKSIMQIEIINPSYEELLRTSYSVFNYPKYHTSKMSDFEDSYFMSHPKLTCEALFEATMQNNPIHPYPQIGTTNLKELQKWSDELNNVIPNIQDENREWQG